MSARDELFEALADTLGDADFSYNEFDSSGEATTCVKRGTDVEVIAEHILKAGYRKPRALSAAEELDALAPWSVIRSEQATIWEKFAGQHTADFWAETMTLGKHPSSHIALPATVLYEPTA